MSVQQLKDEVNKLNQEELFSLMRYIIKKVEENDFPLSQEWKDEIIRRDEAYKNGDEELIPWSHIKKELLSR